MRDPIGFPLVGKDGFPSVGKHASKAVGGQLAYHTAVIKGTDVDQPRNLAKSATVE